MIRVILPSHLRIIAKVNREILVKVEDPITLTSVLDALEREYPMLSGTIRDHTTRQRRAFIRFFACEHDLSLESPDSLLPAAVVAGIEPLRVVGAMAGG
jgi:molybdopterin synthase sulfur carrier subunit